MRYFVITQQSHVDVQKRAAAHEGLFSEVLKGTVNTTGLGRDLVARAKVVSDENN